MALDGTSAIDQRSPALSAAAGRASLDRTDGGAAALFSKESGQKDDTSAFTPCWT